MSMGQPTHEHARWTPPLELGGKRSGRIAVAVAELSVAEVELLDAVRKLHVSKAAAAYALQSPNTGDGKPKAWSINQRVQAVTSAKSRSSRCASKPAYHSECWQRKPNTTRTADLELVRFLGLR